MTRWAAALVTLTIAALTAATLAVVPAGAQDERPPVISITPNQDLVDGQVVTVRAARFEPNADAAMAVCSAAVFDSLSLTDCHLPGVRQFQTGPAGGAREPFTVQRVIVTDNGTVDCGERERACVLGVATGELPTSGPVILGDLQSAWRSLRFAPGPLGTVTSLSVESASPDVVDVRISCAGSSVVSLAVSMSQTSDGEVVASGSGQGSLHCTDQHLVTVAMADREGRFRNGEVRIAVDATAPGGETSTLAPAFIRGDRWYDAPATFVDAGARLSIKRSWVAGDEVRVRVHLRCSVPTTVDVAVQVGQLVRGGVVEQSTARFPRCDGPTDVVVPVRPINVFFTPGRANVRASIIGLVDAPRTHLLAVAPAELDSLVRPQRWTQPARPEGPTRVGIVTTTGVPVAADCESEAAVVSVRVLQRDGRRLAVTQASGPAPCTGQLVTLDPARPLEPGPAVLKVRTSLPAEISEQVFRRRVR